MTRALPDVHFLFVGGGAQRAWVERRAKDLGLTNVSFQPYQPLDQLAWSLTVPDVHLVSLKPEFEGLMVPSKFYSILAAGRPVLFVGDLKSEIADELTTQPAGGRFPSVLRPSGGHDSRSCRPFRKGRRVGGPCPCVVGCELSAQTGAVRVAGTASQISGRHEGVGA